MEFWKDKVAIVTGAGEGIGEQIARYLLQMGMRVIGFEVSNEKSNKISTFFGNNCNAEGIKCDISIDEDLNNAFEYIERKYGAIHLIVNNAVTGKAGLTVDIDDETLKKIIDVNVYGLVACTNFIVKSMVRHNVEGLIINVNSICGHYMPPFQEPTTNLYLVSKRFMTSYTKLLRKKLKNLNIKVTSISPGIVKTNLFKTTGLEFVNDEFFDKNPHLTSADVSKVVVMVLETFQVLNVNEIIFHALNEIY